MKNSVRLRYIKVHLVFVLAAVVITCLFYFLFVNSLSSYNSKYIYTGKTNESFKSVYIDFNHDGTSTKIVYGKAIDTDLYFVVAFNENGTVRDQFNFFNKPLNNYDCVFDWNDDGYNDLVVFTRSDSNLFISVIDIKEIDYIIREKAIIKKPTTVETDFWDLRQLTIQFNDINGDGISEMYLSPLTGHSIYPRGLYQFEVGSLKLINKFETTAPINIIKFFDFNEDGRDEIILRASSSGNTRDKKRIHDQNNWLLILDENLNLVHEPKPIGEFLTSFEFNIIKYNDENCFLIMFANNKNNKPVDSFSIYNFNLDLLHQKISKANTYQDFMLEPGTNPVFFYVTTRDGRISKHDFDFNEINMIELPNDSFNIIYIGDLCDEEGLEVVVANSQIMYILSSNLSVLNQQTFDATIENFSLQEIFDEPFPNLYVDTQSDVNLFKLESNFLHKYAAIILIMIFIFSYVAIFILHRLISRITRTINAYNYTYDDVDLGIIITDFAGRIKSYNKNIFYNLPPDSNIQKNKNIFSVFHKTDELLNTITKAFKSEQEVVQNLAFTKDDYKFIGSVQILPLFTLFKVPHAFIIKIQNLTKQIERDRTVVWSKISQKIAHDIKTPLSTIQLNLSALKSRLSESEIDKKSLLYDDVNMIQAEIKQITELTRSFLKFANMERPNLQWVDIAELIDRSIASFKKHFENGIKFESEINDNLKAIWADPNQIVQLFHILLENAIDAVGSKGNIKISVNLVDDLQHQNDGHVEILVTDTGKGMNSEELSKVFEPYFTQKKDGTGLGMAIAKKIIEDHNGTIFVNSKFNLGTTITIRIPHNINDKNDKKNISN